MGHTIAKVTPHTPDISKSEQIDLLVDTDSTYTWISNTVLERINVKAKTTRKFKTIDGRLLERKIGEVLMEYMNEKATRMVVFAEKGDVQVLGVDALEGLGLEVDPITK